MNKVMKFILLLIALLISIGFTVLLFTAKLPA